MKIKFFSLILCIFLHKTKTVIKVIMKIIIINIIGPEDNSRYFNSSSFALGISIPNIFLILVKYLLIDSDSFDMILRNLK